MNDRKTCSKNPTGRQVSVGVFLVVNAKSPAHEVMLADVCANQKISEVLGHACLLRKDCYAYFDVAGKVQLPRSHKVLK